MGRNLRTGSLVVVRHGQSLWNRDNLFTGWWDCDLSEVGQAQARQSGDLLRDEGLVFSCGYSSLLTRAIRTLWLILERMDRVWLPVMYDFRLNERHYGALTGKDKAGVASVHGAEQVAVWRRSYAVRPPAMECGARYDVSTDGRYAGVAVPRTESLHDTLERVVSFFDERVVERLVVGEHVLIAAHGNSLRALFKHVFGIDDRTISTLEIPVGSPLLIEFSEDVSGRSARYLDSERAAPLPL